MKIFLLLVVAALFVQHVVGDTACLVEDDRMEFIRPPPSEPVVEQVDFTPLFALMIYNAPNIIMYGLVVTFLYKAISTLK